MPQRIQRRRTKGWKAPLGVVNCTRPGKWGNPFKVGDYVMKGDGVGGFGAALVMYTCTTKKYADSRYTLIETPEQAVEWYRWYMETYHREEVKELRGKDLMCFCGLDAPCHVDVLLELANK